jgi:hypothetical protein
VRQTRTITYEKIARAKIFFIAFPLEIAVARNSARPRASNAHARRAL